MAGLAGGLADNGGLPSSVVNVSSPVARQGLIWNGTAWVSGPAGVQIIPSFNGATDGTAINAALTALAGPGMVFLPVGTGIIDTQILLGTGQWLVGAGWGTVLQAANSLNAAVITNSAANSVGVGITDLLIDGNRGNNTSGAGIKFDWTGNTISSVSPIFWGATLHNLYIRFTAGDGYTGINPTNGMGIQATNLWVDRPNGNGYTIQHSDSVWVNVNTEKSGLGGFVVGPNGAGNHFTNCAGNDCGQVTPASGNGFWLGSSICLLTNCMAQHNSLHGYYLTGTGPADCVFAGCIADGNSFANGSANAAGFYIDTGVPRTVISGCTSRDIAGSPTQAYGFYLNGTCNGVRISGSSVFGNILGDYVNNSSGAGNEFVGKTARVNAQSGATYTFVNADIGLVVESTGAGAATFTIPTVATGLIPVGAMIEVFQAGAGQVTIAGAVGVTLRSDSAKVKTAAQYATIALRQRATDEWVLSGDLA